MVTQLKRFLSYFLATVLVVPFSLFINFGSVTHALAANDERVSTVAASPVAQTTATLNGTNGDTVAETPTITPEPTTLEPTPAPTVATATASIVTLEPAPTQSPSQWTFEKVELNKEYIAPQNSGVKLTFTKLPSPAGSIKIEEITLTPEQIQQTGSLSDKAYDITSDMTDGSFSYNLSLPIPEASKGKTVEVKFAEELSNIGTAQKVENTLTNTDTSVSVTSLDHFTVFVVTHTEADCSGGVYAAGVCYATIQSAINAAALTGDIINVAAGTYNENLTIDKSLTLLGAGDTTLINGNINSTGDNVTIQDLKITNSNPYDGGVSNYGVKTTAGKALTLANVTVDVLYYGVYMTGDSLTNNTVLTINDSSIKGYGAVYLNGAINSGGGAISAVVTINNTSLIGATSYSGTSDDFSTLGLDNAQHVNVVFTGTSSVANEYTGGAKAKERLITFWDASNNAVTGTPIYTYGHSEINDDALFVSGGYGSGYSATNTVAGKTVGRYAYDTATFEAAIASGAAIPIIVGRAETPIVTTAATQTLVAGAKLIIEAPDSTPVTISSGTTLVNNGTIIIEPGATFINNGTIAITVTANAQSKERGASDPALTYTGASSLVNGDTFTGSLTRTAGEAIGTYPITQGTLSAGTHYAITYIGANLTISDTIAPTIPSYTVSETKISPNNDGTKDSSSIDVAYSEQVNADINILDNLGVKVRDLYNSAAVTNPTARVWDGKNNLDIVVADGVYTIQVIGTDSAGNTVTDTSKTITVDNIAPVIALNGVTPAIEIGGIYTELGATAVDAVDGSFAATPSGSVNTALVGSYTITYNATDSVGNHATPATRTVNVVDTTAPTVISVDSDTQKYKFTTSSPHTVTATFSENISNTPTIAVSGGAQTVTNCGDADAKTFCFAYAIPAATEYTTKTIQISGAQDIALNTMALNNSHTFIVDTVIPQITVSGLISGTTLPTINIANAASYTMNGTYTELGAMSHFYWRVATLAPFSTVGPDESMSTAVIGTDVPWSHTWTNFFNTKFTGEGTFRISFEVYDLATNYGHISYDGAYDLVAPTATVSYDVTAPTNGSVVATITPSETVTGALTHTFTDNGSFTFNFTDLAGNPGSVVATVSNIDTIAPVIALHEKITVEATSSLGAVVTYTAPDATDNIDATASATCSPAPGSTFPIGITSVTCNKTDSAGNSAIPTIFQIKVEDTTAPAIFGTPSDMTIEATGPSGEVVTWTDPTATDLVDGTDAVTCAPLSGSTFTLGITAVTCSATDAADNTATSTFNVTVQDTTAPTDPVATPAAGDYMTDQSITLASTDGGSGSKNIYYTLDESDPSDLGNLGRTLYAGAITVDHDMTIKAIAYDNADNASNILTAVYDIAPKISGEAVASIGTTSVTITWTTDQPATSRVIYDTSSHNPKGSPTNYGYAFSTGTTDEGLGKTKNHSITITGLTAGTTYYYCAVSSGSPETVGDEKSFSTQASVLASTSSTNQYSKTTYARVAAIFSPDATGSGTTSYTPAFSATPTPSAAETNSPEVKGEQTESTKNDNPWLWIIMAIVLLGAGTGAYLYLKKNKEDK